MSNYLDKISDVTGATRTTARVANVIGSTALAPRQGTALGSMLDRAKAVAPRDVKDGVGTLAGAAAGAIIGHRHGHWLLGGLSGASIGRNGPALLRPSERKAAMHNLAVTHAGVAGSLVFKQHPAIGFIIGAVAGEIGSHYWGLK